MKKWQKQVLVGSAIVGGAAALAVYVKWIRPWHLVWGSTPDEVGMSLPMDKTVDSPSYVTTRTITIHDTPEEIWPWLAQMGELPRGGFYSYEWIERVLGMQVKNADTLLPEFQELRVGQALDRKGNMVVRGFERNRWLVLGPPKAALEGGDATWCMFLKPMPDGSTRFISRCRAKLPGNAAGLIWLAILDPGQFVMEWKWLTEVKARAESHHHANPG